MNILVMKFGGTSVEDLKSIKKVAAKIEGEAKKYKIIVVLSAMAGVTNDLQRYVDEIDLNNSPESDLVITSGEQISVGLLTMVMNKKHIKSHCMLGWQVPIITNNSYGKARILKVEKKIILKHLKNYDVIVVAGFQGISSEGKISSLGRGGSDITAVALASALNAERCDIYTDVDGVFSTDPNIDSTAKKIDKIAYEEMLEMSSLGAKVLQTRSVELAMKNNLQLQVLSSIKKLPGTMIVKEEDLFEKETVSGVSYSKNEAKITISGVPDVPGISAKIFGILADNNINVDMIVQNISQDGLKANLTFTVHTREMNLANSLLHHNKSAIKFSSLSTNANVAKISVIGMGMKSQSGVAKKMFQTLANKQINILAISTSEIKISVLIDKKFTNKAVKSLHKTYKLSKNI
jgi:aspartate kinase